MFNGGTSLIRTSNLVYGYPHGLPIQFPDLDVGQGSIVLLTGPSGCGKSTWLALVAGLVKPLAGTLTVANRELGKLSGIAADAWRARTIGFLPQKLHLSAALTVAQNLCMAQWAAGQNEDLAQVDLTLKALGVGELALRKPSQISGGQAQRVALARAVLMQPKIILADEPTASLDDETARSAVELLVHIANKQGATLVIATHDSRVASAIPQSKSSGLGYTAMKLSRHMMGATA